MQSNMTVLAALIGMIAFMALLAILIDIFLRRRRDRRISRMDELDGHDFEFFCADLLRAQGFIDVEVTRGSGDFGVDILAEKDGVTYAIQCKRYSGPVGVEAVLRTYGGLAYYERMVGAVMTNQYFTSPAVDAAKSCAFCSGTGAIWMPCWKKTPSLPTEEIIKPAFIC